MHNNINIAVTSLITTNAYKDISSLSARCTARKIKSIAPDSKSACYLKISKAGSRWGGGQLNK